MSTDPSVLQENIEIGMKEKNASSEPEIETQKAMFNHFQLLL